ncbi:P-loop NTPase fold protein [Cohnella faecalis]|uniref:P-loop NTPase fold protein n=1 Tax=Cohnella faecalis TaxID=2315694 RepID=UPI0013140821|nr:P-loop NTPase fold protein [Cohnella faecalis]
MANLISLREVDNMAIGLFGAWGSGKSFFMKQIKSSVEKNKGRPNDLFHQDIVQIEFNTWHYMDSNLYASLASHIFQKIYDHYKEPESRENMINSLPLITDLRKELNVLQSKKEKFEKELTSEKIGRSVFTAIHNDSEKLLNEVEKLAPNNKTTDKIKAIMAYKNDGKDTLAYLLKVYSKWKLIVKLIPPLAWIFFLLSTGLGIAFFFALHYFFKPNGIANCAWLATLIGYATTAKGILNNEKYKSVKNLWNILTDSLSKVAESRQKIESEIEVLDSKIQNINDEIDEINEGKIIQYYLAERIRSDAYKKELGIINVLRNDFEKLSLFMQTKSTEKNIGRIILYIDDLDRCSPQKVIEVLQAVHLILSAKIFMVIVAVDIRWITKCLHQEYKISLDYEKMNDGASAYDYLEKIFQITYQVNNLSVDDNRKFIKGLFEMSLLSDAKDEAAGAKEESDDEEWNEQDEARFLEQLEESESEEEEQAFEEEQASAYNKLTISEQELSSIIEYAGLCGRTPRTIKRFVNNYRLIKTRYYKDFEPHSTLLLLSLTTGYPLLAIAFLEAIKTSASTDATLNSIFEKLLENENPPKGCKKVFDFIRFRPVGKYLVKDTLATATRVRRYSLYLNDDKEVS